MSTTHNFDWTWEGIGNDIEADYLDQFEPRPHYTETWSWLMAQERERAWFQPIYKCRQCKARWAPEPYLCIKCRMERAERNRRREWSKS